MQERRAIASLRADGETRRDRVAQRGRLVRLAAVLLISGIVVSLDQTTKSLAVRHLHGEGVHLLGPFWLRLEFNSGVAFSIGQGHSPWVVAVVLMVVVALLGFAYLSTRPVLLVGIGLVLGGALGNLGDRIFRHNGGAVIDFIYSGVWPTFNLADASVVLGCVVLALASLRR